MMFSYSQIVSSFIVDYVLNFTCISAAYVVQDLFQSAHVDFTDYIRTTEERHVAVVETFWVRRERLLLVISEMINALNYILRINFMTKVTFTRESTKAGTRCKMKPSWLARRLLTVQNWVQRSARRVVSRWSGAQKRTISSDSLLSKSSSWTGSTVNHTVSSDVT